MFETYRIYDHIFLIFYYAELSVHRPEFFRNLLIIKLFLLSPKSYVSSIEISTSL